MPGSVPGGSRPPATDADRERLAALLREHYALGQFELDELDRRVGMVLGANAVVAMRFDSSEIGQQLTEIVAYGTAVVVRPTG